MQELFKKYLRNQCSPEEVKALLEKFGVGEDEELLRTMIGWQLETDEDLNAGNEKEHKHIIDDAYQNISTAIWLEKQTEPAPVISITRRVWFRAVVIAVVILGIAQTYLLLNPAPKALSISHNKPLKNDFGARGNRASLTLADGSIINLEDAPAGKIAREGNAEVVKLDNGRIIYTLLNEKPIGVTSNTVTTPRGGQYQLTLADGTRVWLNSASTIRYPAVFNGNARTVELKGEAYFEVAKNSAMPFKINVAGKKEIEVLGTHFNINCYEDEKTINTTLIEGSIKVTSFATQKSQVISPGQQIKLTPDGQILINENYDLDQVIAWKNGYFNFEGADTYTVMRFISRWYDVDVEYEAAVASREFTGEIEKNLDLPQVLKILKEQGLSFKLEGRKLTVKH
jgi:transmembrane sensor